MGMERLKPWIWFVALYVASVVGTVIAVYLVRMLSGAVLR